MAAKPVHIEYIQRGSPQPGYTQPDIYTSIHLYQIAISIGSDNLIFSGRGWGAEEFTTIYGC